MSVVRAASTSRIAFTGEIGSIVTRDRPNHLRVEEKWREECRTDVDSRPARDPVGRVERTRRCGRCSTRSRWQPATLRPRRCRRARDRPPRDARVRAATRDRTPPGMRGERAGPERPDDLDVRGGESLGERLELAQQHTARAGVGALLASGALDLPPRELRVDLEADEELVIGRDRRARCSSARGTTASRASRPAPRRDPTPRRGSDRSRRRRRARCARSTGSG